MRERRLAPNRSDDEPVDPDIALITDYLSDELPAAEAELVEDRLLMDDAFHEKVSPLIMMWTLPASLRPSAVLAMSDDTPDELAYTIPTVGPSATAAGRTRISMRRVAWLAAAALTLIVARPVYEVGAYAIAASDVGALAKRNTDGPDPDLGAFVSTRQGEETTVAFPNGSHVTLRPQSRLTWRPLGRFPRGIVATLKGEATIDVTDAERTVFLGTMMGGVILRPGIYAVRCELGCTAMRVTVGSHGRAYLNGTGLLEWVSLGAGEHGEVRYPYWPTHTSGYQYPEIKP